MKNILLILFVTLSSSSMVLADVNPTDEFFSLTYSSKVKNTTEDFSLVGFNFGKNKFLTKKLGAYADIGISTNANQNGVLNFGLTYSMNNRLNLLGGVGVLFSDIDDSVFSSGNKTNYNIGLMYRFSRRLGVTTAYNTASKTYNAGFSFYH